MSLQDNLKRPAPKWYRKFENAYIIVLAPAIATVISTWGLPELIVNRSLQIIGLTVAIVKAMGMIIANGEVYANQNDK